MAFKSVDEFNGNFFKLPNDGDYADVVFLYNLEKGSKPVIIDAHYIKSSEYSGYAHCCGEGCPACAKRWRLENHLFIPLYNIQHGAIEFFDRTTRFLAQLSSVFSSYSNPSEYVFRITRHGAAGDINTRYEIRLAGKNTRFTYDNLAAQYNITFPDYYDNVARRLSVAEMDAMINKNDSNSFVASAGADLQEYVPTPRAGYQSSIPEAYVPVGDVMGAAVEPSAAPATVDTSAVSDYIEDTPASDEGSDESDELPSVTF